MLKYHGEATQHILPSGHHVIEFKGSVTFSDMSSASVDLVQSMFPKLRDGYSRVSIDLNTDWTGSSVAYRIQDVEIKNA